MGGASGGYVSGRREIVELLRQRARPYLFSNSIAPPIAAAGLKAIELVEGSPELRERLWANTARFRGAMTDAGFDIVEGTHPIVPVMMGEAAVAAAFAEQLWARGVYAVSFSFPVVPRGQARIRTQLSAAHSFDDVDFAVAQFAVVRDELQQ
jgi:glycine C-acetyltransferase